MPCQCAELPNCINYEEAGSKFVRSLELVAEGAWARLCRCLHCNTHWQLDVDHRSDLAIKITKPDNWPKFDDKPYRREYFMRLHGGEGDAQCTWPGCRNRALKDIAICVDHAYPEFAPG